MKKKRIIYATGQMCNQFWILSNILADCIQNKEKVSIWYVNFDLTKFIELYNSKYFNYPLYPKVLIKLFGFKNYNKIIKILFSNRISIYILKSIMKLVPYTQFRIFDVTIPKSAYKLKYIEEIMKLFKPDDEIFNEVFDYLKKVRLNKKIIIGIHIRHGDYLNFLDGKYYYSFEKYFQIIQNLQSIFDNQNVCFLICSNEKVDLTFFENHECYILPNSNSIKDLVGLSLCDYICGPPSTYSAWASLYKNVPIYFIEDIDKNILRSDFIDIRSVWF